MKSLFSYQNPSLKPLLSNPINPLMASSLTQTRIQPQDAAPDPDDILCTTAQREEGGTQVDNYASSLVETASSTCSALPGRYLNGESRVERAWAHWTKLGRPRLIVAPMVDNSELPFRLLCRKYGAEAAYTPMLHSRIFTENEKYRNQEFTTCKVIEFGSLNLCF
uniref:tRNA-dihydrouridine16/17 synthase NADP+-like n=1 Tax=Rhizophora mucronata TaxID=61149 RepID=A0A2P2JWE7_RHIMU